MIPVMDRSSKQLAVGSCTWSLIIMYVPSLGDEQEPKGLKANFPAIIIFLFICGSSSDDLLLKRPL